PISWGCDIPSFVNGDLFAQLRLVVHVQGFLDAQRERLSGRSGGRVPGVPSLTPRAALHSATLGGATALGLGELTGSLTPGKQADIVLLAAGRELRYRPNEIARGLKTARSMSVGVLLPDLTNPLFPPIVRGIEDVLAAAGYTALIANTDNDPDRQTAAFETLRARQVDGFIVATAHREDSLFTDAHRAGVTIVLVNRRL